MAYRVRLEERVHGDVAPLSQGDQKAFDVCVRDLKDDPNNHTVEDVQHHPFLKKARFAGDMRAIFYVEGNTVYIVRVGRSTEALYRELLETWPPDDAGPQDTT